MVLEGFLMICFLSISWSSKKVLLIFLTIEMMSILLSFFILIKVSKVFFMLVLMIGVLEIVIGLTLLILTTRFFGNDKFSFI